MENKTPESSKTQLLNNMLSCNDYYAKLFVNNLNEENLIFKEATFNGYKQITLNKNFWQDSIIESGNIVSYYNKPLFWRSKNFSSVYIRGYYIVDSAGDVIWYQRFPSIVEMPANKAISVKIRAVLGCLDHPTATPIPPL